MCGSSATRTIDRHWPHWGLAPRLLVCLGEFRVTAKYFFKETDLMGVNWSRDIDQTLAAAKQQSRPVLLDFSAAPA